MTGPPDFRDLVGDELPADERERLQRVHDLLVEAGPPPELPPSLAEAPHRGAQQAPSWLPRRRLGAALSLAATIAVVAFLGGYLAGFGHNSFDSKHEVAMHGTSAQPGARGVIKIGASDSVGNLPMVVTVRGLPRLSGRAYYELFLTRNGKPVAPCVGFNAKVGTSTTLTFSVPYSLKRFDGWVVLRVDPGSADRDRGPVLLTT